MIPQQWLTSLEKYKEYDYDKAYSIYKDWLKTKPYDGLGSFDGEQFFLNWRDANNSKNFTKWDSDLWYGNLINGDTHFHPQGKDVAKYVQKQIKSNWVDFDGNPDFYTKNAVNEYTGIIDKSVLNNEAVKQYSRDLSNAKKKSEKERLQQIVDNINKDKNLLNDWAKQVDDYWKGWDEYNDLWGKDFDEYKKKWEDLLDEIKNGKPEPEPEPQLEPEPEDDPIIEQEPPTQEEVPNVFSAPQENTFQNVTTTNDQQDVSVNETHTRIYEYMATTIELDEMSIPIVENIDSNATIDSSTGQHEDVANSNLASTPFETKGNTSPSKSMAIGFSYPLLRINDHYYSGDDIVYFSLESVGFIPTIMVKLSCAFNDILKTNMIKDGDKCSVFMNPGHGTIKSYRGDFQITQVKVSDMDQFKMSDRINIKFIGELFIPTIYDATQTFAFSGSSRDALIDAAEKLGLGFFFSDPENTNDVQMWYSMSDGEQKENEDSMSPAIEYIQNTAKHAYKNFESFFDCWIDPRYAITFLNVAQMLGGEGLDEPIDLALYNSTIAQGKSVDAKNRESTDEEKDKKPKPQPKLLTNIGEDESSLTAFLVTSYSENNDGTITNKLGLSNANYFNIKNQGLANTTTVDENQIEMNYSIPVNADKLKHGFYIMAGPGQNLTYTEGQNGSFVDQHKSVQGGQIAETQSDSDADDIMESGNNMLASGNTNKFYETAEGHNRLCNMWLKKKTISVTLNGCNMQMMRGEKIPMMLRDNFNPVTTYAQAKNNNQMTYQKILVSGTGWFIIKDIKWIYDINHYQKGTAWRTELTLTRREWPIPDYVKNSSADKEAEQNDIVVENDITTGTTKDASQDQTNADQARAAQAQNDAQNSTEDEMTTNGLNSYLVNIYNEIKQAVSAAGGKIKLVSGRRWPVDENGNKVSTPKVQDGTLWKFVNAKGETVWYSSKTSPHSTGDAMDIINGEGTKFEDIIQYVLSDDKILYDMITNGVYLGQEVSSDGGNSIKHYHIGKVDKSNSDTYKVQSAWWNSVALYKTSIKYNGQTIPVAQYLVYSNK